MLGCDDLCREINGRCIIDRVNLRVETGKITALIGPSGSGKSTLLKMLAFLERPTRGRLILDGETWAFAGKSERLPTHVWPRITAVFQQLFLWPHLTLRDNIMLPLRLADASRLPAAWLDELYEQFEMRDFIDRYPNEVSGGQKQRAALVRALALQPGYLLLDEITSALDVEQSAAIVGQLLKLKNRGIGILMITHFLGFVNAAADSVAFMKDGRIMEFGEVGILHEPRSPELAQFLEAFRRLDKPTPDFAIPNP